MLNFCTLFNSVYLSRGLAMYESLSRSCTDFHLYIFAFDDECYNFFISKQFDYITVISLQQFENKRLLSIKEKRTPGEYCWTCTPFVIKYVLDHFKVESCTYVDADLYFFSSPQILIDEVGDSSVLITEHRYTPKYDQTSTSGKYCVQFVFFRNDVRGRTVLEWWANACWDWCYAKFEDGKFGDQKYLDDWCTRFEGVHELRHLGGGVAPWNMQQYSFFKRNGQILGKEIATSKCFELVFVHFHAVAFLGSYKFSFATYYKRKGKGTYKCVFPSYIYEIVRLRKKYGVERYEKYIKERKHNRPSSAEKLCNSFVFIRSLIYFLFHFFC